MKILLTIIFLSLLSSPSWSETFDNLVERDGLYYEKFTDVPFSGKVTGLGNGSIKNGKREGEWVGYWDDGQLLYKGNYKNGKEEGEYVRYYSNGQLDFKGNHKNGKREGEWILYWNNGQLYSKRNYKNGKKEGAWIFYHMDGSLNKKRSGMFRNGVKK